MGLNLDSAKRQSGLTSLSQYEKGLSKPRGNSLLRIMAFYKLTDSEINACKDNTPVDSNREKTRISRILDLMESVIKDVEKIQEKGVLAKTIKNGALESLNDAFRLVNDVLIIERVI
ncbi:MAG TPA: hypothetical protein VK616_12580 [Flavitalea sp.]|nr:hypothetical protein [Flavitalea sp.]